MIFARLLCIIGRHNWRQPYGSKCLCCTRCFKVLS